MLNKNSGSPFNKQMLWSHPTLKKENVIQLLFLLFVIVLSQTKNDNRRISNYQQSGFMA